MIASQIAMNRNILKDMKSWSNRNVQLRLLHNHNATFMLHSLQHDSSVAHAFDMGSFFNKQSSGINLKNFKDDQKLNDMFQVLATFKGSGYAAYNSTMVE